MSEQLHFQMKDFVPNIFSFIFGSFDTRESFKMVLLLTLKWEIEFLDKAPNKSAKEIGWLETYKESQEKFQNLPTRDLVTTVIGYLEITNSKIDNFIFEAKAHPNGEYALEYLINIKSYLETRLKEYKELLNDPVP
jgi:hypothetical protein